MFDGWYSALQPQQQHAEEASVTVAYHESEQAYSCGPLYASQQCLSNGHQLQFNKQPTVAYGGAHADFLQTAMQEVESQSPPPPPLFDGWYATLLQPQPQLDQVAEALAIGLCPRQLHADYSSSSQLKQQHQSDQQLQQPQLFSIGRVAYEDPRQLTKMITSCKSVADLDKLAEDHGTSFDPIHISAALVIAQRLLAKQCLYPEGKHVMVVERLVMLLELQLPHLGARQVSNTIWALAKIRCLTTSLL